MSADSHILERLEAVIRERLAGEAPQSYVARLGAGGPARVREKVREEAAELLEASEERQNGGEEAHLVHEAADLLFHLLVLLAVQEAPAGAVSAELERRFGTGGLAEKAAREDPPA